MGFPLPENEAFFRCRLGGNRVKVDELFFCVVAVAREGVRECFFVLAAYCALFSVESEQVSEVFSEVPDRGD